MIRDIFKNQNQTFPYLFSNNGSFSIDYGIIIISLKAKKMQQQLKVQFFSKSLHHA